ncbi:DJ-1/PfpI family protein [Patescibacteria group bacterium]
MLRKSLENKKVAMIVAFRDFRDEEYFIPKNVLERAGADITTVSTSLGKAIGVGGGDIEVDVLLDNFSADSFDAVIFIGGGGALKYLDNEISYNIAREAVSKNKTLAAICIAPVILAKAGVLSGKKATVWSSPMERSPIRILKQEGVIYQDNGVVVDNNIITAIGSVAAKEFGEAVIEVLTRG